MTGGQREFGSFTYPPSPTELEWAGLMRNCSASVLTSPHTVVRIHHTGVSFGEVAKLVGEAWKVVSAEEKAKYEKMAAADKER